MSLFTWLKSFWSAVLALFSTMAYNKGHILCPSLVIDKDGFFRECGTERTLDVPCKNKRYHRTCICGKASEISDVPHECIVQPQQRDGLRMAILILDTQFCKACHGPKDDPMHFGTDRHGQDRYCKSAWHTPRCKQCGGPQDQPAKVGNDSFCQSQWHNAGKKNSHDQIKPLVGGKFECPCLILSQDKTFFRKCGTMRTLKYCHFQKKHRHCACGKARDISQLVHECVVEPQQRDGLRLAIMILDSKFCTSCNGTKDSPGAFHNKPCANAFHKVPEPVAEQVQQQVAE